MSSPSELQIHDLVADLYVAGEPVTMPSYRYPAPLGAFKEISFNMPDRNEAHWSWRIVLSDLVRLDADDRPGWVGVTAAVFGVDGVLYAPFRPFLVYGRPWVYPSLLVWPDAWAGPIVLALSVPGKLGTDPVGVDS